MTASTNRPLAILIAVPLLVIAGCVGSGASPTASSDSTATSASPTSSAPASGFYLRAWQTQALAPQYVFGWLPAVTIADGEFIDGMVAVPAIYPGPLWTDPSARAISSAGIDAIVAEARQQGLLGTKSNFVDTPMPGAITGHIQMIIDGKTYDLVGDPQALTRCRCIPDPGTSGSFAAFWQEIGGLSGWIPNELGQSSPYEPESLAVMALPPTEATSGITPSEAPWPLATPFSSFGTALGNASRCAVVTGADLATLEPVVKRSNQLTRFVDSSGAKMSLQVRVLVPREPSPC